MEEIDIIDDDEVLLLDLLLSLLLSLSDLDAIFAPKLYPDIVAGQTHT